MAILLSLSLLELALEYCGDFMPYNQLFKPILKEGDVTTNQDHIECETQIEEDVEGKEPETISEIR